MISLENIHLRFLGRFGLINFSTVCCGAVKILHQDGIRMLLFHDPHYEKYVLIHNWWICPLGQHPNHQRALIFLPGHQATVFVQAPTLLFIDLHLKFYKAIGGWNLIHFSGQGPWSQPLEATQSHLSSQKVRGAFGKDGWGKHAFGKSCRFRPSCHALLLYMYLGQANSLQSTLMYVERLIAAVKLNPTYSCIFWDIFLSRSEHVFSPTLLWVLVRGGSQFKEGGDGNWF